MAQWERIWAGERPLVRSQEWFWGGYPSCPQPAWLEAQHSLSSSLKTVASVEGVISFHAGWLS